MPENYDPNAEVDFADPRIAFNFGTRALDDAEQDQLATEQAAITRDETEHRAADARYATWAAANPGAAAAHRAAAQARAAALAGADPWAEMEPEAGS
jgi:hypothetical protein